MKFSDTTNKNGIIQLVERLCKLGDGGITNDTTLFKQITGDINQAYKKVAMALLRVDKSWKWDDSNYTDFPIATIDIVASQRDYTLPASTSGGNASTLYRVNQVRFKVTGGQYQKLELMNIGEEETASTTTGVPTKYNLVGNSIRLNIVASANSTAGLEVTFQRSLEEFTTSDTTKQPGFMDSYHDLLAYDASSTYLLPLNTQLAVNYSTIFSNRTRLMQDDYAKKNDDSPTRLTPNRESTM